ncbi:MAG: nucleotide exchange factor GrpE [Streptosporangiaceae bacterium]
MPASEETGSGPVIHDNRRIDPVSGQVRGKHAAAKPAGTTGAGRPAGPQAAEAAPGKDEGDETVMREAAEAASEERAQQEQVPQERAQQERAQQDDRPQASDLEAQLRERTADLQRLQAEYANYRKRVDRDRAAVREQAVASTLAGLLPALDAIDQAREHGELSGGFKSVADSLQAALGRLGLVAYGEKGDPFDPKIHEALTHSYSPDVTEVTCVEILQPGYKVGDRILRPARVAVAEPATGPDGASNEPGSASDEDDN